MKNYDSTIALFDTLGERTDLRRLETEITEGIANAGLEAIADQGIIDFYSEIGSLTFRWTIDLDETTIETLDTGLDVVGGMCRIPTPDELLDESRSIKLCKSPIFERNKNLTPEYLVFDNCSPEGLALLKRQDNKITDRVYYVYNSYPSVIFDLGMTTKTYYETGLSAGFFLDWPLAILKIKKYGTESISHYLPLVFPEFTEGIFMRELVKNGLTESEPNA